MSTELEQDQASFAKATVEIENEKLRATLAERDREIARLAEKSDAEMLRVKACEHIADGDEGWENLRNECPSTAAVARLRDELARKDAALQPFAKLADSYDAADAQRAKHFADEGRSPGEPKSGDHRVSIALGECRAARAALSSPLPAASAVVPEK